MHKQFNLGMKSTCYLGFKSILLSSRWLPLVFVFFFSTVNAAELDILVYPESDPPSTGSVSCVNDMATQCTASLTEAFKLIQNQKWQDSLLGKFSTVRVRLGAGVYRLTEPINLRWGNGVTSNVQLEILGVGHQSVISGAVAVKDWSLAKVNDLPARVSEKAKGNVWVADVSRLKLNLNSLPISRGFGIPIRPIMTEFYVGDKVQAVAAWPNIGYGRVIKPVNLPVDDKKTFSVEGRKVVEWVDEPDLQMTAFWFWDWAAQTYLVASKDIKNGVMQLLGQGSPYGIKSNQRLRVENALAELDVTGEWYLNRASAKLYFWPDKGFAEANKELSVSTELLHIDSSKKVNIRDMAFEKVRGDAVVINNSSEVHLDQVAIRFTGNRAVAITNSASCGIRNSLIEDNGEGGVFLNGGDRQTLQSAGNFVERSEIKRFSRLVKTYRFGIELSGVGQRALGNKISDAPHTAVFFSGNNHVIANNEIFNVVRETSDAGAIYVGRDYTARGTLIENNYLHDIHASLAGQEVKGIYLDDQASGTTVRGNLIARVQQPVFIGGGRDNVVENNLFFKSSPAIHLDARGLRGQKSMTVDPKGTLQKNLDAVPYRSQIYASRYPNLPKIREDDIGAPKYNIVRNNLIVGGELSSIEPVAKSGISLDGNFVTTEVVFADKLQSNARLRPEDFRLESSSIPLKRGFVMPPLESMSR